MDAYVPVSPASPPALLIDFALTLPLRGVWLLHTELLRRRLDRAEPKAKRDETAPLVGDDGELADWFEQDAKAKRLSSTD